MKTGVKILLKLNRLFPAVPHPFNSEDAGGESYGKWEYDRGESTVTLYYPHFSAEDIFAGKDVLDVGCGEGGKAIYYAAHGAASVVGIDTVEEYSEKSARLAKHLGVSSFSFVTASALSLPFEDESFDSVIMSDFFEHVSNPEAALSEAMRVLRSGGRLFINFPPYFHPYGAHLSDAISIPWVHLFFREKTLIPAYKALIEELPDKERRLALKITPDGKEGEHIGYINKMTLKKARRVIRHTGLVPEYKKFVPLRKFLAPLVYVPALREVFVRSAVYVFKKDGKTAAKQVSTSRNI